MEFETNYCPKELDPTIFHTDNEDYHRRFFDLVNDPALAVLADGEKLSEKEYWDAINKSVLANRPWKHLSIISFVPSDLVKKELDDESSNFSQLVKAFKSSLAYKNKKLFFNPLHLLHFTYHVPKQVESGEVEKTAALLGQQKKFRARFQGLTFMPHINGRIFLCLAPEKVEGENGDYKIREALTDGKLILKAAAGLVNLRSNLNQKEAAEISQIMKEFEDKPLFEYVVDKISIVNVGDSLLLKYQIIQEIELK